MKFSFKVMSDNEESNLMVKASSSGQWCGVSMDKTNRKLIISIKDKPLCERRSYIKVNIVDYPETYKTLI